MKIYTKKGDSGTTGLLGGDRVPKHHLRIESYGNVDELNSHLGMLRDLAGAKYRDEIVLIQEELFTIGSHLAVAPGHEGKMQLPEITNEDVERLERWMDAMDNQLPEMKNFILPGGHLAVSQCHISRCVCRRAERSIAALAEHEFVPVWVLSYMNRLSDYLFVLARLIGQENTAEEIPWRPR